MTSHFSTVIPHKQPCSHARTHTHAYILSPSCTHVHPSLQRWAATQITGPHRYRECRAPLLLHKPHAVEALPVVQHSSHDYNTHTRDSHYNHYNRIQSSSTYPRYTYVSDPCTLPPPPPHYHTTTPCTHTHTHASITPHMHIQTYTCTPSHHTTHTVAYIVFPSLLCTFFKWLLSLGCVG